MADNKKDSFTFSDKIKNSKPAFSPFSKRGASKIGNNGKPKKTLFERTRRDAPFMAAAAAALLLLPFLYKYSGNVEDGAGSKIITPGIGDEFVPERFDFDPAGDGNLAQLSGRDPLSLIKGWGEPEAEPGVREGLDDLMPPQTRAAQSPVYQSPYRPQVVPQVRAAVARPATKINELRGTGLNFHGGGGIGSRFGGAELRQAARAHSGPGPSRSTKPVSLQPLRAAGTPSRAYYGNQSLARARQSRDAMSKADAPTALKDALFTAAPARGLRGLGEASAAAGGPGGPGNIDRTMDFKGMTPWWWDMMKDRSQKMWEWKYFLWRKNLIEPLIVKLAEVLGHVGAGMLNCLLTGEDDGDMGSMWGTAAQGGKSGGCRVGKDADFETYDVYCSSHPEDTELCGKGESWFKQRCKNLQNNKDYGPNLYKWDDGESPSPAMTAWQKRKYCMGNSFYKKYDNYRDEDSVLEDAFKCQQIRGDKHLFQLKQGAKLVAEKQKPFHIVLAENTVNSEGTPLCGNVLHRDHQTSRTSGQGNRNNGQSKCKKWEHYTENGSFYGKCLEYESPRAVDQRSRTKYKDYKDEAVAEYQHGVFDYGEGRFMDDPKYMDACVVYLAWGDSGRYSKAGANFSYARYKGEVEEWLHSTGRRNWNVADVHPVAIVGFSAKESASFLKKYIGYTYKDFLMGVNEKMGAGLAATYCDWGAFNITASEIDNPVDLYSKLHYSPDIHGPNGDKLHVKLEIVGADNATVLSTIDNVPVFFAGVPSKPLSTYRYQITDPQLRQAIATELSKPNGKIIARWTATSDIQGEKPSIDQAEYQGSLPAEEPVQGVCEEGQVQFVVMSTQNGALTSTVQTEAPNPAAACYLQQTCGADKKWTPDMTNGANFTGKCDNGSGQSITGLTFAHDMLQIQANPNSGHQSFKLDSNGQVTYQPATGSRRYQAGSFKSNDLARFNSAVLRDSESADMFMADIANKYNAKHNDPKDAKLVHVSGNSPKLSEFVDALITAGEVGVTDVEKSAVCEMARSIAKVSVDEQVPGVNVSTIGSLQLSNVFGAFAIYLGPEAVYFPAYNVKVGDNPEIADLRFAENPYMAGNYIDPKWGGASATSKQEIAATGFPLEELRDGFNIPTTVSTQAQLDANRRAYRGEYSQIFFADNGQCAKLAGTMPIAKVLQYMDKVKELSLSYKPKAAVSSGNNNFSSSSTVNGSRTGAHR